MEQINLTALSSRGFLTRGHASLAIIFSIRCTLKVFFSLFFHYTTLYNLIMANREKRRREKHACVRMTKAPFQTTN
jgi:hypothetical protein